MSILTGNELEFLASLRTSWRRLYCSELERLLKEGSPSARQSMGGCDAIGARQTAFYAVLPSECPGIAETEPVSRRP